MLTNSKLLKAFIFSALFGTTGSFYATANPAMAGVMVTQQKDKITGIVEDEMGPVAGASISVKGTSTGTITDMDGKFIMEGLKKGNVLVVSFVGMTTQQIVWNGENTLRIKLSSDTQNLDEVVVVAYGTTKKSSFTGSAGAG